MALKYEVGFGGKFRRGLISAGDIVSAYALAEIYRTRIRDIAFDRNHGTLTSAGGCTRGVSVDLPEGALGTTFDGTGHVLIADDGLGFYRPGDSSQRNLSCSAGDANFVFLMKTSQNDASERIIWQKHDGTKGISITHVSGQIRFKIDVTAGNVINMVRGSVSDNVLHLIQCSWDASAGQGKILIDNVQSGATVSTAATDPEVAAVSAYIGGKPANPGFIGTLCYLGISRNADVALSTTLQATRAWTDVTTHVRSDRSELSDGMVGTTLKDRQAGIGTFTFVLNNTPKVTGNSPTLGYYTVGGSNCRSGFDLGVPVRFTDGSLIRFRGWLSRADPEAGKYRGRRVFCQVLDWFSIAARTDLSAIPILVNARSDDAWASIIDEADQPPVAVSRTAGSSTFPFVFDRVGGMALSEMAAVAHSEGGYSYILPDTVTGGVVTFEPRGTRQLDITPDATFLETMKEMKVGIGEDALLNIFRPTVTPRFPSAVSSDILYSQTSRQRIPPGESVAVQGSYQDASQSRSSIGGTDFQTFTSGTDYTMNTVEGGTGLDLTAYVSETHVFGGSGFTIEFRNTHPTKEGWIAYQIRGRALRTDVPLTPTIDDRDSIRAHGPKPYEEEYVYLDDAETAIGLAQLHLSLFKDPIRIPNPLTFRPVPGSALDTLIRARKIGDLIAVQETMAAITTSQKYWIQSERLAYSPPNLLEASYGVFPSFAQTGQVFGQWDVTNWDACLWGY